MVYSSSIQEKFWAKVEKPGANECWNWLGTIQPPGKHKGGGYGMFSIKGRARLTHRLSFCLERCLELADIDGKLILHSCDNPACVNPRHLRAGTNLDNAKDREDRQRHPHADRGERSHHAKLTNEQVLEIRELLKLGVPQKEIASRYNVIQQNISFINTRQSWSHI